MPAYRPAGHRHAVRGVVLDEAGTAERMVGQLSLGNIVRRAFCSAHAGYWVDASVAGRGIIPTALALAVDHAFRYGGLHRIEVNIRPENLASRRVVEKLGFREEALQRRYLHIDGAWRDHVGYALTAEDLAAEGGLLSRWHRLRDGTRPADCLVGGSTALPAAAACWRLAAFRWLACWSTRRI